MQKIVELTMWNLSKVQFLSIKDILESSYEDTYYNERLFWDRRILKIDVKLVNPSEDVLEIERPSQVPLFIPGVVVDLANHIWEALGEPRRMVIAYNGKSYKMTFKVWKLLQVGGTLGVL
jgi:hypothetical protein